MVIVKHCPNCGSEIADDDIEFCTECGYNLLGRNDDSPVGFFAKLNQKTSFPVIIFSFVIFLIYPFIIIKRIKNDVNVLNGEILQ